MKSIWINRLFILGLMAFIFVGCENKKGAFLESRVSKNSHEVSLKKLQKLIKDQGLTHFHSIDHKANAKGVDMNLKPQTLVVFGNPKMGTMLMNCNPSMGLDLPLRILIATDYEGTTTLSYTNPEYWSLKHNIKDKRCLAIITKAKIALGNLTYQAGKK